MRGAINSNDFSLVSLSGYVTTYGASYDWLVVSNLRAKNINL